MLVERGLRGLVVVIVLAAALAAARPAGAVSPSGRAVDVPAPWFWDSQSNSRAGAEADRVEVDGPGRDAALSSWYRLAYIAGGDRLRLYEHSPRATTGPASTMAASQASAWRAAVALLGDGSSVGGGGELPGWARARTGNADGPSAGLIFALADLDLLTAGRLVGRLRVAGTGAIASDGAVTSVRLVDAKIAAALLADPDVIFSPDAPEGAAAVTVVPSHAGTPSPERTIGDWLDTDGYEAAGRAAAVDGTAHPVVIVDDVRQALAWLCGRTGSPVTCSVSTGAALVPLGQARPFTPDLPAKAGSPR